MTTFVTAAVQGDTASGDTDAGTNPVKIGGPYSVTPPTLADGQRGSWQMGARGSGNVTLFTQDTNVAAQYFNDNSNGLSPSATNNKLMVLSRGTVFTGTTWQFTPGDAFGTYTVPKPVASGGLSVQRLVAATSGIIKASAGQLYTGTLTNSNATIRYLQIYNKATAGTLSTDTPVMTIPLPPSATVMIDFSGIGGAFTTGISWQFTTDDVAIPTTAGATTDIHGFVAYK